VKQSGLGAAIQAIQDGRSLQSLIEDVCVPGASTEKAMARLEQGTFSALVTAAVEKSLDANRAMGKDEMTKVQSHV